MKKKIIWVMVVAIFFCVVAWFDFPYLVSSKNLISNQNVDYTYERISFTNWYDNDLHSLEVTDEIQMKNIIDKIDGLKLRRTRNFIYGNEEISFTARYAKKDMTYVEGVFSINFKQVNGDNYLAFIRMGDTYKSQYYKILNKDFNIEKFIEELKAEVK